MRIIGCDLHARQQTLAMLDTTTGEAVNLTLQHESRLIGNVLCRVRCRFGIGLGPHYHFDGT